MATAIAAWMPLEDQSLKADYFVVCARSGSRMPSYHDFIAESLLLKAGYSLMSSAAAEDIERSIKEVLLPQFHVLSAYVNEALGAAFFSKLVRDRVSSALVLIRLAAYHGDHDDNDEKPRLRRGGVACEISSEAKALEHVI